MIWFIKLILVAIALKIFFGYMPLGWFALAVILLAIANYWKE